MMASDTRLSRDISQPENTVPELFGLLSNPPSRGKDAAETLALLGEQSEHPGSSKEMGHSEYVSQKPLCRQLNS